MSKIAIIAALENELKPFITGWKSTSITAQGRTVRLFERDDILVAFGGIGVIAARIAADAAYNHILRRYNERINLMISAGLAGSLVPELRVGYVLMPETIISESEDTTIETSSGIGVLLTAGAVAGLKHKQLFAEKYHAQAVDMEAFAVADVARIYNLPFIAMKGISDEFDFDLPPLGRFISDNGEFRIPAFVAYTALRPWTWRRAFHLSSNSVKASIQLCEALELTIKKYARTKTATGLIVNV